MLNARQHCSVVTKKNQWVDILARMEHSVRKWEAYAPACVAAGLNPIEIDPSSQEITVWDLTASAPLIKDMSSESAIDVPRNHGFAAQGPIVICSAHDFQKHQISEILPVDQASVVVRMQPGSEEVKRFATGASVTAYLPTTYSVIESKAGHLTLVQKTINQPPKEIGRGFDHFEIEPGDSGEISMSMGEGHCYFRRSFELSVKHDRNGEGKWFVHDDGLNYVPWAIKLEG
jgi:hypothetical protein